MSEYNSIGNSLNIKSKRRTREKRKEGRELKRDIRGEI
jgi:hypothetical protein